jgi:hypothetical protein
LNSLWGVTTEVECRSGSCGYLHPTDRKRLPRREFFGADDEPRRRFAVVMDQLSRPAAVDPFDAEQCNGRLPCHDTATSGPQPRGYGSLSRRGFDASGHEYAGIQLFIRRAHRPFGNDGTRQRLGADKGPR